MEETALKRALLATLLSFISPTLAIYRARIISAAEFIPCRTFVSTRG